MSSEASEAGTGGLGSVRYRTTQGVRTILSPLMPLDGAARDAALSILPLPAIAAFRALPKADQRHALRIYQVLVTNGETENDLLGAALLHDVGKHPGIGITQRTARVLLARWPRALVWTAANGRLLPRWRSGMARLLNHAALGADLAASWGCTPATAAIIRTSHDPNPPDIVRRLQVVDDTT
ncbi:MAG: hypothetical protein M3Z19_10165 [Chloroflexota bacterium]|nr:hypothetical protein [Chloroflexota bacterium]